MSFCCGQYQSQCHLAQQISDTTGALSAVDCNLCSLIAGYSTAEANWLGLASFAGNSKPDFDCLAKVTVGTIAFVES